jgi:hypothetical protein
MQELPLPLTTKRKLKKKKKETPTRSPAPRPKPDSPSSARPDKKAPQDSRPDHPSPPATESPREPILPKANGPPPAPSIAEPETPPATAISVGTELPASSAGEGFEKLLEFTLPSEQIDKIHRGRKTTLLTKARREYDWAPGARIRLSDGTVLTLLKKEKIWLGPHLPEELMESEGFSLEHRAEFVRSLQQAGFNLRVGEGAFLYRIQLTD